MNDNKLEEIINDIRAKAKRAHEGKQLWCDAGKPVNHYDPGLVGVYLDGVAAMLEMLVEHGLYITPKAALDVVAGERPLDKMLKTPIGERGEAKKHSWLELPRNITLKRFVNTRRETRFVGQYRDDNPTSGNPNPRRIYTIDVLPMWDDLEGRAPSTVRAFEVTAHCDGNELFRLMTMHGRAVAEYLGVKALKAWLNYCGSQRRGKQSRKLHSKRNRANRRARRAERMAESANKEEA